MPIADLVTQLVTQHLTDAWTSVRERGIKSIRAADVLAKPRP